MKCPVDGSDLAISERQGVEIDYCPQCRGVWLDRGELDKVIERSEREGWGSPPPRSRGYDREEHAGHSRKRKKGFLGELFEFGD